MRRERTRADQALVSYALDRLLTPIAVDADVDSPRARCERRGRQLRDDQCEVSEVVLGGYREELVRRIVRRPRAGGSHARTAPVVVCKIRGSQLGQLQIQISRPWWK